MALFPHLFSRPMKLRSHLWALVLISVFPVLIFSGVMIFVSYRQQRADLDRGMIDTARARETSRVLVLAAVQVFLKVRSGHVSVLTCAALLLRTAAPTME